MKQSVHRHTQNNVTNWNEVVNETQLDVNVCVAKHKFGTWSELEVQRLAELCRTNRMQSGMPDFAEIVKKIKGKTPEQIRQKYLLLKKVSPDLFGRDKEEDKWTQEETDALKKIYQELIVGEQFSWKKVSEAVQKSVAKCELKVRNECKAGWVPLEDALSSIRLQKLRQSVQSNSADGKVKWSKVEKETGIEFHCAAALWE